MRTEDEHGLLEPSAGLLGAKSLLRLMAHLVPLSARPTYFSIVWFSGCGSLT